MEKKLSLSIILLLMLITFIYVSFINNLFAQYNGNNKPKSSSNYKNKYVNTNVKVSFSVPYNWRVLEKVNKDGTTLIAVDPKSISFSEDNSRYLLPKRSGIVEIISNPIKIGIKDPYFEILPDKTIGAGTGFFAKFKDTLTSDNEKLDDLKNKHVVYYFFQRNNTYISLSYVGEKSDEYINGFNEIVNSFQLIN